MDPVQSGFLSSDLGLRCFSFSKESLQSIPRARAGHQVPPQRLPGARSQRCRVRLWCRRHAQPLGSAVHSCSGLPVCAPSPHCMALQAGDAPTANDFITNGAAQARRGSPSSEPWGRGGQSGHLQPRLGEAVSRSEAAWGCVMCREVRNPGSRGE